MQPVSVSIDSDVNPFLYMGGYFIKDIKAPHPDKLYSPHRRCLFRRTPRKPLLEKLIGPDYQEIGEVVCCDHPGSESLTIIIKEEFKSAQPVIEDLINRSLHMASMLGRLPKEIIVDTKLIPRE
jgi:hypothetical protein